MINFPLFLQGKQLFVTTCLLSNILSPFLKGVFPKRKEFAPKFFPFRADPFQKGTNTILTEIPPAEVFPFFFMLLILKFDQNYSTAF